MLCHVSGSVIALMKQSSPDSKQAYTSRSCFANARPLVENAVLWSTQEARHHRTRTWRWPARSQ